MKMSRIDLLAPPFRGHLHPILAMAKKLQGEYIVRVLSTASVRQDVEAAGVSFVPLHEIDDQALLALVNPPYLIGRSPIKLYRQYKGTFVFFNALKRSLFHHFSTHRPDLIIADFTLPVAGAVADELGIRWWTSLPSPCVMESPNGPPSYLGGLFPSIGPYSHLRNWLGRKFIRLFKRTVFKLCKSEANALGFQNPYRRDGSEAIYSAERILCIGSKELEFDREWPGAAAFIGPMLFSPSYKGNSPKFIAGKTHVLVTLGTHLDSLKNDAYNFIQQVARGLPDCVFHFSDGHYTESGSHDVQENCHRIRYVDYQSQIRRYDIVIHHGGAGIMYHCLQVGIPAVVWPQDYDQFDHAARLSHRGLAVWCRKPADLEGSIVEAKTSHEMKNNLLIFSGNLREHECSQPLLSLVEEAMNKPCREK